MGGSIQVFLHFSPVHSVQIQSRGTACAASSGAGRSPLLFHGATGIHRGRESKSSAVCPVSSGKGSKQGGQALVSLPSGFSPGGRRGAAGDLDFSVLATQLHIRWELIWEKSQVKKSLDTSYRKVEKSSAKRKCL